MDQTYVIIFESDKSADIKSYLKTFRAYTPITKTAWSIRTSKSAGEIRSEAAAKGVKGDKIFVIRSGTEAAWINQPQAVTDWLKKYL